MKNEFEGNIDEEELRKQGLGVKRKTLLNQYFTKYFHKKQLNRSLRRDAVYLRFTFERWRDEQLESAEGDDLEILKDLSLVSLEEHAIDQRNTLTKILVALPLQPSLARERLGHGMRSWDRVVKIVGQAKRM